MGKLKGLKLGGLNINSLSKNIEHIRYILSQYSFYIFAINESKIDSLANDSEISIPGYRLVRTDKNRNGGGVVIYVQEHLSILVRNDLVQNNLEMVCIEINQPFNRTFLVSTWYRPPNSRTDVFDSYDIFLLNCDAENKELILLGDINCDVAKSLPEAHTIRFQSIKTLYNMARLIEEPTRVARTSATIIDLILKNVPEKISHAGVMLTLVYPDHSLANICSSQIQST
jgi:exonuclease III